MRFLSEPCLRRPRAALAIAALLTLIALVLVARLRPQTALTEMFDGNDPSVAALQRIVDEFPVAEELLVLASLPEGEPADVNRLRAFAERLDQRLADEPAVTAVRYRAGPQFGQFVRQQILPNGLLYLDAAGREEAASRLTAAGMADQLRRTRAALAQPGPAAGALGRALANDPLRLFELLSDRLADAALPGVAAGPGQDDLFLTVDGRGLLLRIDGAEPPGDLYFARRMVAAVQAAVDEVNDDRLDVQLAGAYAVAAYDTGQIQWDSIVGTVTGVGGLALVIGLLYRRPLRLFALAFAPVAVGVLWGFGLYAVFSREITPLAAVIGGALGGIGIDYPVHFLAHYDARRRSAGSAVEAARATLAELGRPTAIAWGTSVIGFAAVALSPVGTLRDFAVIGSLGLLGAGLATDHRFARGAHRPRPRRHRDAGSAAVRNRRAVGPDRPPPAANVGVGDGRGDAGVRRLRRRVRAAGRGRAGLGRAAPDAQPAAGGTGGDPRPHGPGRRDDVRARRGRLAGRSRRPRPRRPAGVDIK